MTTSSHAHGAGPVPAETGPVVFDAFLHPHRSLSGRGFRIVMGAVVAVSLGVGGIFLMQGAWPVFGFYGLEVLVLWLCLRQNYRSARIYERLRLTRDLLTVERGDAHGACQVARFQPHWLRVSIDDPVRHESQILLSSHGRSIIVGAFLSPKERLDLARALRAALDGVRQPTALTERPA